MRAIQIAACASPLAALFTSAPASADIIHQGDTIPLFGTTLADRPDLTGAASHEAVVPFDAVGGSYHGHVEVRWIAHPQGSQQQYRVLDFDDGGAGYSVVALRVDGFYGMDSDVNFMLDGAGVATPSSATYDTNIEFSFPGAIFAGSSSVRMYYLAFGSNLTDGLDYWGAAVSIRTPGGDVETVPFMSYGPFTPSPGASAVLVLGSAITSLRRKRDVARSFGAVSA